MKFFLITLIFSIFLVFVLADPCNLPAETGPCDADFSDYFFNMTSKTCEEFVYGGCEGNENRFGTIKECQQICGKYMN
ncbi:hypothetical protein PVAND_017314 [Polypedilum vanderplanki]|uniref:Single Kunitz protease inhibitor n=1 Tax=Polypedilum vanderplanki TaxID=319348 RepID=A0A9J6BIP5_POLVA|nr:hypothetical protein PVAND_017314 [Polypedilum vanderplanki]